MGGHPPACPCPSEDRPKQTESPGGRAGGASGTGRTQIASSTAPTSGRAARWCRCALARQRAARGTLGQGKVLHACDRLLMPVSAREPDVWAVSSAGEHWPYKPRQGGRGRPRSDTLRVRNVAAPRVSASSRGLCDPLGNGRCQRVAAQRLHSRADRYSERRDPSRPWPRGCYMTPSRTSIRDRGRETGKPMGEKTAVAHLPAPRLPRGPA